MYTHADSQIQIWSLTASLHRFMQHVFTLHAHLIRITMHTYSMTVAHIRVITPMELLKNCVWSDHQLTPVSYSHEGDFIPLIHSDEGDGNQQCEARGSKNSEAQTHASPPSARNPMRGSDILSTREQDIALSTTRNYAFSIGETRTKAKTWTRLVRSRRMTQQVRRSEKLVGGLCNPTIHDGGDNLMMMHGMGSTRARRKQHNVPKGGLHGSGSQNRILDTSMRTLHTYLRVFYSLLIIDFLVST